MTPSEQAALEVTVAAACTKHQEAHWWDMEYRPTLFTEPGYFVKYGNQQSLWPEIATQLYISQYAESRTDAPRIPKIVHHFQEDGRGYLVTEYIKLRDPAPSDLPERAAAALKWLSDVPAPSGHVIGPLGGGYIRHRFFKEREAPLRFTSTEALERYVNRGRFMLSRAAQKLEKPVSISGERLIFTQSDVDARNFAVDEDGNTVLVDFGSVGVLPVSFVKFTLAARDEFTAAVSRALGWGETANQAAMARIATVVKMASEPRLGLDEDGYPKKR